MRQAKKWVAMGAALGLLAASAAMAQVAPVDRLPPGANAAAYIDVAALLKTPLGIKEGWRARLSSYDRPVAVPPTAQKMTMAAGIEVATLEPTWQASIIELIGPADLKGIAAAQGGYIDEIAGKPAVHTRADAFYVQIDDKDLGVFWPGVRQKVAKWIGMGAKSSDASPFLREAISGAGEVGQITMALDLNNAYSTAQIFQIMAAGGFKALDKFDGDVAVLSARLAKVKGIVITVNVSETINVMVQGHFDGEIGVIAPFGKELARELLAAAGLPAEDVANWDVKSSGSSIIASGRLSERGMQHLLSFFAPPAPFTTGGETPPANGNAPGQPAISPEAAASQGYYRALAKIVDGLQVGQASMQMSANVFRAQARKIATLPILNVDPVLLQWGSQLTEALNRSAQISAVGQQTAIAGSSAVMSPTGYTGSDDYNGYNGTSTAETRAAFRNAQAQRRTQGESQRASSMNDVASLMNDAIAPRGKVRAEMVEKYKVEF